MDVDHFKISRFVDVLPARSSIVFQMPLVAPVVCFEGNA